MSSKGCAFYVQRNVNLDMASSNLKETREVKTQIQDREEWLNKAIEFFYKGIMNCFDIPSVRTSVVFQSIQG